VKGGVGERGVSPPLSFSISLLTRLFVGQELGPLSDKDSPRGRGGYGGSPRPVVLPGEERKKVPFNFKEKGGGVSPPSLPSRIRGGTF
jgi:hypothetical protein